MWKDSYYKNKFSDYSGNKVEIKGEHFQRTYSVLHAGGGDQYQKEKYCKFWHLLSWLLPPASPRSSVIVPIAPTGNWGPVSLGTPPIFSLPFGGKLQTTLCPLLRADWLQNSDICSVRCCNGVVMSAKWHNSFLPFSPNEQGFWLSPTDENAFVEI